MFNIVIQLGANPGGGRPVLADLLDRHGRPRQARSGFDSLRAQPIDRLHSRRRHRRPGQEAYRGAAAPAQGGRHRADRRRYCDPGHRAAVKPGTTRGIAAVPAKTALGVGFLQCLAMIPGVSRSGATILGALTLGVERRTAAEFSFFLAIPTMLGASVVETAGASGRNARRQQHRPPGDRGRLRRVLHRRTAGGALVSSASSANMDLGHSPGIESSPEASHWRC
ncbi:Undecaprenyl-diphosphatase [Schistosoma japonicum]|uniref:Undecaprenyl-diphosphatase n=1 Tax=Schistosoma japonicum TaxID=6182 RepID=A0A4Z2CK59_SCHJA|nr:Undecaprenyl-diphosphatase [Schistosoma japonicum]